MKPASSACIVLLCLTIFGCNVKPAPSHIWFIKITPTGNEIVALNPEDKREQTVVTHSPGEYIASAGLSPNGAKIAYLVTISPDANSVWIANSDGSDRIEIPMEDPVRSFVWMDNARLLIASTSEQRESESPGHAVVWALYDLATRQVRPLVTHTLILAPPQRNHSPNQSAGIAGTVNSIVFRHFEVHDDVLTDVFDVKADPRSLPPNFENLASSTRDGSIIAFTAQGGSNNKDIFLLTDKARKLQQLTDLEQNYGASSTHDLAVSPDGRWIIFSALLGLPRVPNVPTELQVALASSDGKTLKFLTELPESIRGDYAWSPDNRRVAASLPTRNAAGEYDSIPIQVIDAETGVIERVTEFGGTQVFDWR